MAAPHNTDDDDTIPHAISPGNQGARGSRGQANSGAQPGDGTNQGGRERVSPQPGPDLGKDKAQGGGGPGSESSRSR